MKDQAEGYVTEDGRKIGGVLMEMKNITLRFGGVTAIKDISFDIREGEIVKAKVLRVTDSSVILEFGFKSEGSVALDEFA